jgi:hypothetical protein
MSTPSHRQLDPNIAAAVEAGAHPEPVDLDELAKSAAFQEWKRRMESSA